MEFLFSLSEEAVQSISLEYVRPVYHQIAWDDAMVTLLGTRGVGKTTLILQRLKQLKLRPQEALYVDLGGIYFQENRLLDFARAFVAQGGKYLFLDEVHRYGYDTWAQELKQIYDLYHVKLKLVVTGSSAIRILHARADLSRRALQYRIPGLSFREYLFLTQDLTLPTLAYTDILQRSQEITNQLLAENDFKPLSHLGDYWTGGYYPFFLASSQGYLNRLSQTVQLVLESDIPSVIETGSTDYQKISRLLYAIASSVPFKPNVSKLAERIQLSRDSLYRYLELLERANMTLNLRSEAKGTASLGKPDKIYLENTNLLYALAPNQVSIGTVRETFFFNQLRTVTTVSQFLPPEIRLPKAGDFVLLDKDQRYVFEVGGPGKTSRQIGNAPGSFVVQDTERASGESQLPLWLFGLLY